MFEMCIVFFFTEVRSFYSLSYCRSIDRV